MTKPIRSLAIRELVETMFPGSDLLPVSSSLLSAQVGMRLHQAIQSGREGTYRAEVPLRYEQEGELLTLRITGRIDGLLPGDPPVLEEIKSHRHTLAAGFAGEPVHWAQAMAYAAIYCRDNDLPGMMVRLIYIHSQSEEQRHFDRYHEAHDLMDWLQDLCARYLAQVEQEERRIQQSGAANRGLDFPFGRMREGQRQMIDAVQQHVAQGATLFVSAPTGIGKTMGTLYPAVRAMAEGACRKLFYLTARNPVKAVAEESVRTLISSGFALRGVTLTAKDALCPMPDGTPCHPEYCPRAAGFFDRLPQALDELPPYAHLGRREVLALARRHTLCPHELELCIAEVCDVVVCDYNNVFDPRVRVRRFFDRGGEYHLLVDEAHNLVDRARDMYSAVLEETVLRAWLMDLPLTALTGERAEAQTAAVAVLDTLTRLGDDLPPGDGETLLEAVPGELTDALDELADRTAPLLDHQPQDVEETLLDLYFMVRLFQSTQEELGEEYRILLGRAGGTLTLRLRCIDPARRLRESLKNVNGAVFFSATLTPFSYYTRLLGAEDPSCLQLPSPFPPEHLKVLNLHVDTTWAKRAGSIESLVEALGAFAGGRRGNYLFFFPSYQYMNDAHSLFSAGYPDIYSPMQAPGMGEGDRAAFLAAFEETHPGGMAAFAVMGGIFGEGIDLAGERVIGVAIVGVGLPQVCLERNLMQQYHDELEEPGYEYAYTIPGFNRVMQAVGRLIRGEKDRGVVLLADRRFGWNRYRELTPPWWQPVARAHSPAAIDRAVRAFWRQGAVDMNDETIV